MNETADALQRLRALFVAYRDAPMTPGKRLEVQTIRRTLNVVVAEIEKEIALLPRPEFDPTAEPSIFQ